MISSSLPTYLTLTYQDKLLEVRNTIVAWNDHTKRVFMPYWLLCLNEYMPVWMNKFIFPGFLLFSCKTHPNGNDYHTICCSKSVIMYVWKIFKGRDHLIPMGIPEFDTSNNMNEFGLIL